MTITTFASGSSGNCTLISFGNAHFLIDAGISFKRIRENLALSGIAPAALTGVLITHEHRDHTNGLATMAKRCEAPIYAPRTVANRLRSELPDTAARLREFPVGESVDLGGVAVRAFHTPHDTDESVGWRLSAGAGETFALATDMGAVTDEIWDGLCGADAALIESNHDVDMLVDGPYPYSLKRRILSDHGHLSNADCAVLAARLAETGTGYLILGHLSRENNHPALAFQTVSQALNDTKTRLFVAPAAERLTIEIDKETVCALSS